MNIKTESSLPDLHNCTEVRFTSYLSCGFTNMAVTNPPERKVAKCTSVNWFRLVYRQFGLCTFSFGPRPTRKDLNHTAGSDTIFSHIYLLVR